MACPQASSMNARRILVIAPIISDAETYAGRHRVEGLIHAWARAGHEVHVLTPGPLLARRVAAGHYHTTGGILLRALATRPRAYWMRRRLVGKLLGYVSVPDRDAVWIPRAYLEATRVVKRHGPFDVIFSSFSSATSHLVSAAVAKRFSIPWVADYRDIWTDNVHHPRGEEPLYLHRGRQPAKPLWRLHAFLERRALRHASCVTTIAGPLAAVLAPKTRAPVHVVPNGYDDLQKAPSSRDGDGSGAFSIVYTGKLNNSSGFPEVALFFDALRDLLREIPAARDRLECRFWTGGESAVLRELRASKGLEDVVQVLPRCSFDEAVDAQRTASVLLLMLPLNAQRSEGVSSRKLFDYLAARRPVLGIVPEGSDASDILARTAAGCVVGTREEAAHALVGWFKQYQKEGRVAWEADEEVVDGYAFSALAPAVLRCLDEAVGRSASDGAVARRPLG